MRTPTKKQYDTLSVLGNGAMLVSGIGGNRRTWTALLRHGWVAPRKPGEENGLQITPDGYRALALGLEAHGHEEIDFKPHPAPLPLLAQKLRSARDEAREERDEAQREVRRLEVKLGRAKRILEEVEAW